MPIAPDTVVAIAFELYGEQGELIESVSHHQPTTYVHGYAQLLPGLEAALEGCAAGDAFELELEPAAAYGERNEAARLEIDRADFPGGEAAEVGSEVLARADDGHEAVHRVVHVDADTIVVDLNHPLAGQRLRYAIEVCAVRAATEEEIAAAQAEINERIDSASGIVYESDRNGEASYPRWSLGLPEPPQQLVQLRNKPSPIDEDSHEQ